METMCSVRPETPELPPFPSLFPAAGGYQSLGSRQIRPLFHHSQGTRDENPEFRLPAKLRLRGTPQGFPRWLARAGPPGAGGPWRRLLGTSSSS